MLITPEQLEAAHKYRAKMVETALTGNKYKLKGGCVLTVNTRGKTILTRDEAFVGDEDFRLTGTFVKATNYNEYKSFVILQPAYPADFSNLHMDFDQAMVNLEDFGRDYLDAISVEDKKIKNVLRIIKEAATGAIAVASKETITDTRFGSW